MDFDIINYENDYREMKIKLNKESTLLDVIRHVYTMIPPKCYFFHIVNNRPYRLVNNSKLIYSSIYYLSAKCNIGNVLSCKNTCVNSINLPKEVLVIISSYIKPVYHYFDAEIQRK